MRIPIILDFDVSRIVGFMEIKDDVADPIMATAMDGLTLRLNACYKQWQGEQKLIALSVSSLDIDGIHPVN